MKKNKSYTHIKNSKEHKTKKQTHNMKTQDTHTHNKERTLNEQRGNT